MPLKKSDIEKYKKKLLQLRAQLTQSVQEVQEQVKEQGESKGYSQHQADEGTDDFERMLNLEVSNKETNLLKQIDRALEKIEEGTYGICDISKKEIPKKRLDAIPYANMTVEAQNNMEKGNL